MIEEKKWCVYVHENKINRKRYCGITSKQPKKRWKHGHGYSFNNYFTNSILKYGWDEGFYHYIIFENLSEEEAKEKEILYIKQNNLTNFNYGYNFSYGGDGVMNGRKHTEETKNKISQIQMGRHISDEWKNNISKSLKNKLPKNFNINFGSTENLVKIIEFDDDFNIINTYISVNDCARKNNIKPTNVTKCARAKHKKCNNKIFMYEYDIINKTKEEIKTFRKKQRDILNYSENHSWEKVKIALLDKNGNIERIFESINKAGKELNIDSSSIVKVCKGRLKQTHGYNFIYYKDLKDDTHLYT